MRLLAPTQLSQLVFCAGMLLAGATQAQSEVIKCVDAGGEVTLTNTGCDVGSRVAPPAAETALPSAALVDTRLLTQRAPVTLSAWARTPNPVRKASLDVMTLKAARLSLEESDRSARSMRQHRIASAN